MLAENFGLEETKEALVHELFLSLKSLTCIPEVVKNSEAFKMMPAKLLKEVLLYEEFVESEDEDGSKGDSIQIRDPKPKKKRVSKSKRAGLLLPVSRIKRKIKESKYVKSVGKNVDVFTAGVLEYLTAEVFDICGPFVRDG